MGSGKYVVIINLVLCSIARKSRTSLPATDVVTALLAIQNAAEQSLPDDVILIDMQMPYTDGMMAEKIN